MLRRIFLKRLFLISSIQPFLSVLFVRQDDRRKKCLAKSSLFFKNSYI